jgi:hypothetical protein
MVSIEPRLFSHGDIINNLGVHELHMFQLSHDFSAMETVVGTHTHVDFGSVSILM